MAFLLSRLEIFKKSNILKQISFQLMKIPLSHFSHSLILIYKFNFYTFFSRIIRKKLGNWDRPFKNPHFKGFLALFSFQKTGKKLGQNPLFSGILAIFKNFAIPVSQFSHYFLKLFCFSRKYDWVWYQISTRLWSFLGYKSGNNPPPLPSLQ